VRDVASRKTPANEEKRSRKSLEDGRKKPTEREKKEKKDEPHPCCVGSLGEGMVTWATGVSRGGGKGIKGWSEELDGGRGVPCVFSRKPALRLGGGKVIVARTGELGKGKALV